MAKKRKRKILTSEERSELMARLDARRLELEGHMRRIEAELASKRKTA